MHSRKTCNSNILVNEWPNHGKLDSSLCKIDLSPFLVVAVVDGRGAVRDLAELVDGVPGVGPGAAASQIAVVVVTQAGEQRSRHGTVLDYLQLIGGIELICT